MRFNLVKSGAAVGQAFTDIASIVPDPWFGNALPVIPGALGYWDFTDLLSMYKGTSASGANPSATNDPVGYVLDKSGNGNHALNAGTLNQTGSESLQLNEQNGYPAVFQSTSGRWFSLTNQLNLTNFSIIAVCRPTGDIRAVMGFATGNIQVRLTPSGPIMSLYDGVGNPFSGITPTMTGAYHIYEFSRSGSTALFFMDGVSMGTAAWDTTTMTINTISNFMSNSDPACYKLMLQVYDHSLTTTERSALTAAIKSKYLIP